MLLTRSFITYMARQLARNLAGEWVEPRDHKVLRDSLEGKIVDELSIEDEINAEVRELLNQYADYMRRQRIPYQEMFWKVKRKVLAERKAVSAASREPGERTMKLSRDKIVELSHKLAGALPRVPGTRLLKPWNEVRLEIVSQLTDILIQEETIDKIAQEKISSQKREIPEGSEEWSLLYRRYYEEEMKRYGIDLSMV